ncbi:amino acid adenylation domain-containing protein [Clostridium sp. DSM 8431]|uniref:non-ribosomal peptide synthetase n=1 Tax=Clostridium sp. DSM 8431 TaxID=1761781 RepID=UPI0008EEBF20|nr:non-ribosomal peptide synthetase [Clostridium sp. DSM 8431]SFU55624.1 amino acid adenylation domain-containing protein [Clostridium sp. DSM 8431]
MMKVFSDVTEDKKEKLENKHKSIWEGFKSSILNKGIEGGRIEKEFKISNKLEPSVVNFFAASIILAHLVSCEKKVNIGVYELKKQKCFEIDTKMIEDEDDIRRWACDLLHEEVKFDLEMPMDIEVIEEGADIKSKAVVSLIISAGKGILSIDNTNIDDIMCKHLLKLVEFSFSRVADPKIEPDSSLMAPHNYCKLSENQSLVERIFKYKESKPSEVVIIDDTCNEEVTYERLWNSSEHIVNYIKGEVNLENPYPRIALFMERSWRNIATLVAVQRLNGTCILIDTSNPDERLKAFLNEVKPDAIITTDNLNKRVLSLVDYPVYNFNDIIRKLLNIKEEKDEIQTHDNEICFIAGTSGSTGKPKAVCLSYSGMRYTINSIISSSNLDETSKGTWLSSPGYGMIEVDPLPVIYAGGTICIPSMDTLKDVRLLGKWINKRKINHTLLMTSIAETIWAGRVKVNLSTMLIAGERCKQWPPSFIDYKVLNVYGSAEAAVVSIEDLSSPHKTLMPSVGKAILGVNIYVVDKSGRELPAGCVGELVITGKTLSAGYINSEQTQKSFKKNVLDETSKYQYSSGDRARIYPDGNLEVLGRTDSLVKIRGHRVDLSEIEIVALNVEGVCKSAACCFNGESGTMLALFVEQGKDAKNVKDRVYKYLQKYLPSASQPNVIRVTKLPLGINGKVDYKQLLKYSLDEEKDESSIFYPTTKTEEAVYQCWLNWTKYKKVSLSDNFFEIGGDSLKAMRMMGELDCKYGIHIEMSPFLKEPTLAALIDLANSVKNIGLPIFEHIPIEEQKKPFELNESQQSLWIGRGSDFNYGGVGCQGYFEWEAKDLDYAKFVSAVGLLVDRHPMLRMTINEEGKQVIGNYDGRDAVKYKDLSILSLSEISEEIDKIRDFMANEEIGTKQWPLFHFQISKINESTSRIHFCIDMLIADAWSIFQTIIPDLIDLYKDGNASMPILKTTFCDYVEYRKKIKESKEYESHKEYWLQKVKELPLAPKLPVLDTNSSDQKVKFDRYEGTLSFEKWTSLKHEAQKRRISPSGVVALVLCEVLRLWSEETNFTLNFPVSDRMPVSDDIDLVVGDFTNTLLVPYEAKVDESLECKGRCLQDAIWEALDHRLFSGVEVLRELSKIHRTGRAPLMPIVLTSLLGHPGRHDVSKLGKEVYGVSQTPQVTLDVQIRESDGVLYFKWDYLKGVIRNDVIKDMFYAFDKLLNQLAENEELWQSKYLDLRPEEQRKRREKVNATEEVIPKINLRDLLLQKVENRAKEKALITKNLSYTWEEVGRAASYIKSKIKESSSLEDKFVGVILPKGPAQFVAVYGCLLSGLGYVPIDIDLPEERVKNIIKQAKVKSVIANKETVVPDGVTKIEFSDSRINNVLETVIDFNLESIREDYSPYIIFTSGSTGDPKGVEIPEKAVVNHIYDVTKRFKLDESTRHLATAALHFDMSVFDVFGPLLHGGSIVIPEHASGPVPEVWLKLQQDFQVNFWACVPALMDIMCCFAEIESDIQPADSLRNIVMAGDWIPLTLIPRARRLFPNAKIFSSGGPTETTNWSIIHEINDSEGSICNSVIYGVPMSNSKYHIVSKEWIERPDWVPGEMVVESEISLARGYIGNEEITQKAFVNHPITGKRMYHTGDLGRYLPNGEIEILGRIDNQIKINGLRIELGEIEKSAQTCEGVVRACAVALADANGKPKQIALAYVAEGEVDESSVSEKIKNSLPSYMVPKTIKQLPSLPLSKNSKVDVKALREIMKNNKKEKSNVSFDRSKILRSVLEIYAENLEQKIILPEDNFFDLGGDSLSAMKIKIELEAKLSITVALEDIMLSNSIGELVVRILNERNI